MGAFPWFFLFVDSFYICFHVSFVCKRFATFIALELLQAVMNSVVVALEVRFGGGNWKVNECISMVSTVDVLH